MGSASNLVECSDCGVSYCVTCGHTNCSGLRGGSAQVVIPPCIAPHHSWEVNLVIDKEFETKNWVCKHCKLRA